MWKIIEEFEKRYLQWPESEIDLVFHNKEMVQAFIDLNLDEEGRYKPQFEENSKPSEGKVSPMRREKV